MLGGLLWSLAVRACMWRLVLGVVYILAGFLLWIYLGFLLFSSTSFFFFPFTVHICSLSVLFFLLSRPSIYLFRSTVFVNFRNACLGRSLDFRANFSRRIWLTIIQPIGQHSWSLKNRIFDVNKTHPSFNSIQRNLVPRHIPSPQSLYTQHTP